MGRPYTNIDQKHFEQLCAMQCTQEEICDFFEICSDTLNSWCKRTYDKSFSEVFRQKRGKGKVSLRRHQWKLAEKNTSMAIWLGKQYLGQRETTEVLAGINVQNDDALSASLKELGERLQSDDK